MCLQYLFPKESRGNGKLLKILCTVDFLYLVTQLNERRQQSYHSVDSGIPLSLLQGFSGLLPAADLLWCQAQQPAHFLPEEATVAIVNRSIVSQDFHSRHFIALQEKRDCVTFTLGCSCSKCKCRCDHQSLKSNEACSPCCGSPQVCKFQCCWPVQVPNNQPC